MNSLPVVKNNDLIVKSNTLNEVSFKLDSLEYKFVLFIASKIKKDDDDFQTITVSVKDFTKAIGVKGNGYHNEIENMSKDIMKKPIKFIDDNGFEMVNWFSYIRYRRNEGILDVRFDKVLKPYLLNLEGNFLQYTFRQISQMKSTYSIRLFELLKQYVPIGERSFDLEYLRTLLGAEDIYPVYANFKQRIINKSIAEIKEKTDLDFEFKEEKSGRKVSRLIFSKITFHPKHLVEIETVLESDDSFIEKINRIFNPLGIYFKESHFDKLKLYDEKMIANAVIQLKNRLMRNEEIQKPISYLFGILKKMKEAAKEEVKSNTVNLLDRHFWIAEIVEQYKGATSIVSKFLLQEKAEQLFTEKGIPKEDHQALWSEIKEEVQTSITEIVRKNRNKRRRY